MYVYIYIYIRQLPLWVGPEDPNSLAPRLFKNLEVDYSTLQYSVV